MCILKHFVVLTFIGGLRAILTDQNKMIVAVGGVTALAAGIYTTRLAAGSLNLNEFCLVILIY